MKNNIKAEELRLGNYFLHDGNIVQFDEDIMHDVKYGGLEWDEPIPLTEEWLLKFGFEKKEYEKSQYKEYEYILDNFKYFRDRFWIVRCEECGRYADVKYVHELQNLYFALTKHELTMK